MYEILDVLDEDKYAHGNATRVVEHNLTFNLINATPRSRRRDEVHFGTGNRGSAHIRAAIDDVLLECRSCQWLWLCQVKYAQCGNVRDDSG